ncbi:FMN reductase (NADH) RutF [Aureimonas endophytica]|uniref:FMN reductase (NADH) RutF n=1 Tax=Aureimonas endophytica TaxID=2027858 RepID=A0A916ZMT6_9HYPH|nr:flavin reductase [Aureimonas endophytica]GGE03766.1 FMN reductase (NADH) RutF [Aureimonas endophytica]
MMSTAVSAVADPRSPVDPSQFREGMSRLAAAVSIVTTRTAEGCFGFTATAICSVTDTPPTLLVCLNRAASVFPMFETAERLCVNTLSAGQGELAALFGGRTPMAERFAGGGWTTLLTGAPVLDEAAVSFDGWIADRRSIGTHDVLFCEIAAMRWSDAPSGLAYFRRAMRPLTDG